MGLHVSLPFIISHATGPGQTHPAMYPASNYYTGVPQHGYPTMPPQNAPPGKTAPTSTNYSTNYYPNSHPQAGAPSGPGSTFYSAPQAQIHASPNPVASVAPQYTQPYGMSANYYGQNYSTAAQGQQNPPPASSGANPGPPLYPIVSYPSAHGSSQYGTLRSSQAVAGVPPTQNALQPQQQYSQGNGATATPPAQQGFSAPPFQQTAAVNGQSNAGR